MRGWKVVILLIWLQFIGYLAALPFMLIPGGWGEIITGVLGVLFGPPLFYWGFKSLYPDPEPRTNPNSLPTECLTCKTTIPPHADTCPSCGWSYKRR